MDLVAGVRKEGSRGGRDSFKWSDVKQSSHRENYLGHSIMAPVGRWQQNRDLNWYAKTDDSSAADKAKQEREEEIRRIKEAEQDAMALALGLPVAPRASNNANLTPLGGQEVRKAVQDATEGEGDGDGDGGRGIGFGSYGGVVGNDAEDEILAPIGMDSAVRPLGQEKDGRDRHRSRRERSRDHDRRRDRDHRDRGGRHRHDRDADREHRHRHHREHREHRRHRSRSRSVSRSPRPERRDRRPEADRRRDAGRSERHRSSSPRRDRERDRGDHESGRDTHHRHHRR